MGRPREMPLGIPKLAQIQFPVYHKGMPEASQELFGTERGFIPAPSAHQTALTW